MRINQNPFKKQSNKLLIYKIVQFYALRFCLSNIKRNINRYESIPKIYYREAKEMRFYEAINRKMDIEFCKKIPMID